MFLHFQPAHAVALPWRNSLLWPSCLRHLEGPAEVAEVELQVPAVFGPDESVVSTPMI